MIELALQRQERAKLGVALGDEAGVGTRSATKLDEVGAEFGLGAGKLACKSLAEASLRVSSQGLLTR